MYRRPRFLEMLHAIREEMSREVDYDVDLFAEMVRSGISPGRKPRKNARVLKARKPSAGATNGKVTRTRRRQRAS